MPINLHGTPTVPRSQTSQCCSRFPHSGNGRASVRHGLVYLRRLRFSCSRGTRGGGLEQWGYGGGGRNLCLSRRGERNSDTVLKAAFIVVLNSPLHERTQRRISLNIAWGACSPPLCPPPLPASPSSLFEYEAIMQGGGKKKRAIAI